MRVLAILAAVAALGGCAASLSTASQPPLVANDRSRATASAGGMLYAAEYSAKTESSIAQYRLDDGSLVRRIVVGERGINALAVDRGGTVYAIEDGGSLAGHYRVAEYAPGAVAAARTISKGRWQPVAMLFNGDGDLYVLDRNSELRAFKPGATQAYAVVRDGLDNPIAMTMDRNGTLYVANAISKIHAWGSVTVYSGRRLIATIGDKVKAPFGVALDGRGTLYVADPSGYGTPNYPSIAQYNAADGRFVQMTTVTQKTGAIMTPGLGADSLGNIYTHLDGCTTTTGGPPHCVDVLYAYPPGTTTPSHVYQFAEGHLFSSMAFDRAANVYLALCGGTVKAGCEVRISAPGKSLRTIVRAPGRTIGTMAIAP